MLVVIRGYLITSVETFFKSHLATSKKEPSFDKRAEDDQPESLGLGVLDPIPHQANPPRLAFWVRGAHRVLLTIGLACIRATTYCGVPF